MTAQLLDIRTALAARGLAQEAAADAQARALAADALSGLLCQVAPLEAAQPGVQGVAAVALLELMAALLAERHGWSREELATMAGSAARAAG